MQIIKKFSLALLLLLTSGCCCCCWCRSLLAPSNQQVINVDVHGPFLSMKHNDFHQSFSYYSALYECSLYATELLAIHHLPKLLKIGNIRHVLHNHSFVLQSSDISSSSYTLNIFFYYYNETNQAIMLYILPKNETEVQTVICYNHVKNRYSLFQLKEEHKAVLFFASIAIFVLLVILILFYIVTFSSFLEYKQRLVRLI